MIFKSKENNLYLTNILFDFVIIYDFYFRIFPDLENHFLAMTNNLAVVECLRKACCARRIKSSFIPAFLVYMRKVSRFGHLDEQHQLVE